MKNIITLFLALSISTSFAETKDELIERLFVASDAEAQYHELVDSLLSSYGDDHSDDLVPIIKRHCTWESWKLSRKKVLSECFTKEDIKLLTKLSTDPQLQQINDKAIEYALAAHRANVAWVKEIQPKVSDDIQKLPSTPADELKSYAEYWNSWGDNQRWNYIEGYKDGCKETSVVFSEEVDTETPVLDKITERIELKTYTVKLSHAVTEFYSNPANAEIPHITAFYLVDSEVRGKDITQKLAIARQQANKTNPNQALQPTVKTPAESGKVQGTATEL